MSTIHWSYDNMFPNGHLLFERVGTLQTKRHNALTIKPLLYKRSLKKLFLKSAGASPPWWRQILSDPFCRLLGAQRMFTTLWSYMPPLSTRTYLKTGLKMAQRAHRASQTRHARCTIIIARASRLLKKARAMHHQCRDIRHNQSSDLVNARKASKCFLFLSTANERGSSVSHSS